jgi:endonuclease/exonuclease/phosphatase (EEP) superfamily protein YafD
MDHEAPNHPMTSVLKGLIAVGVCLGAILTGLGWLAHWWLALDLVNNGLPATAAGAVLLVCLGAITRDWRLIVASALLATINVALVVSAPQGAAADAAPGSERFLRIATFNLWAGNERMDNVAKFLGDTDADAVVLQEMTTEHWSTLHQALGSRYPYSLGEAGLVILSKHPILAEGRIDRPGYPPWMSLMLRWARIEVNGTTFELVGVHLARPFYPELEGEDIAAVTQFVQAQTLPLIVAGDFNMSPWTEKLERFTAATGLKRFNTLHLTWPMRWGKVPLLPLVAIDNVFASPPFAKIATQGGPRLGSDHRPIIADIALAKPAQP